MKHWRRNLWANLGITALIAWPLLCICLLWHRFQADPVFVFDSEIHPWVKGFGVLALPATLGVLLAPPLLAVILLLLPGRRGKRSCGMAAVIGIYCLAIAVWISPKILALKKLPQSCHQNIKTLAIAMAKYQLEHDLYLPEASRWVDEIHPYVGDWSVFRCPSDRSEGRCSYAMNENLSGKQVDLDDNKAILLYETTESGENPRGRGEGLPMPWRHFSRDSGYMNWFAFPDGSVAHGSPMPPEERGHW